MNDRTLRAKKIAIASITVLLTACGGSSNGTVDANGAIDATNSIDSLPSTPDAMVIPDAAIPAVNITVTDPTTQGPLSEVSVIFNNPDGSQILRTTDSFGTASAEAEAGASVTIVVAPTGNHLYYLQTIEGVQPGDSLAMTGAGQPQRPILRGNSVTINFPQYDTLSVVDITATCANGNNQVGAGETSGTLGVFISCTHARFAAVALDGNNSEPTAYLVSDDQQFSNGDQITLTGTWTTVPTITTEFTDVPSNVNPDFVDVTLLNETDDMLDFAALNSSSDPTMSTFAIPSPPIGQESYELNSNLYDGGGDGVQIWTFSGATPPTQVDLGTSLLPWIDSAASYDVTSRQVQWPQMGSGTPDVIYSELGYSLATGDAVTWDVVAPGDDTTVTVPQLPPVYSFLDPPALSGDGDSSVWVTLAASVPSASYSALRVNPDTTNIASSRGNPLNSNSLPGWLTAGMFITSGFDD